MTDSITEEEWRGLLKRLCEGEEPESLPGGVAPIFEEQAMRQRVGILITKAVFGEPLYLRYKLNCGDSSPPV
jgi:hypothetical protein